MEPVELQEPRHGGERPRRGRGGRRTLGKARRGVLVTGCLRLLCVRLTREKEAAPRSMSFLGRSRVTDHRVWRVTGRKCTWPVAWLRNQAAGAVAGNPPTGPYLAGGAALGHGPPGRTPTKWLGVPARVLPPSCPRPAEVPGPRLAPRLQRCFAVPPE